MEPDRPKLVHFVQDVIRPEPQALRIYHNIETDMIVARQTIYHDASRPCYIVFPVIPKN
jgi:hypothetical protein